MVLQGDFHIEERAGGEIVFGGREIDKEKCQEPLWPFLKTRMRQHGSHIALVNPYTGEEYSYSRVVSLTERLSRGLYKLGLRKGKSLCIVAPNSVENALLVLATFAAGGTVHAVNPASVPGEIRRQRELTEAGIIVTIPQLLDPVRESVTGTDVVIIVIGPRDGNLNYSDLLTLGTEDVTLPEEFGDPSVSIATILFSSGTTGLPKGVQITQRNIVAYIYVFSLTGGGMIDSGDVTVLFLPFFHVFGQVVTLLASLVYGVKIVIMDKFLLDDFLNFSSRYKATVLFTVPPVIIGLLNHPKLSNYDLSSLKRVVSGAAPLGRETETQFVQKMGIPCLQGYGMTENMVATINSVNKNKAGSCGYPLPSMEFKIVDPETQKCLGLNQTGDLYMRGPLTMKGYHKNPSATQATLDPEGWLDTGDVGYFDSDGFLHIVDRKKELIKYKGEQVAPAVLEDLLLSHPEVADACVIGRPDSVAGELPMAFVVRSPGSSLTVQEVKDFVAKNTPSYMHLRGGVEFRQQIPKSASGKILRRLLRDELKQQLQSKL